MIIIENKEQNPFYQNNPVYFDEIVKIYNEKCDFSVHPIFHSSKNKYLVEWIDLMIPFAINLKPSAKLYYIFNGLQEKIKCKYCNKYLKGNISRNRKGEFIVQKYCNSSCQMKDPEMKKHYEEISIKKYGVPHMFKSKEVWDSIKQTNIEKYGYESVASVPEIREKQAQTRENRYGDRNYNNREKASVTMMKKYGVLYPMQSEEIKNKHKENCFKKNGVYHYIQCKEISNKIKLKYYYNNIHFDSSYELAYYIWLTDNNKSFQYNPNIKFEYYVDGKLHYYFPDFIVENEIHEIKGRMFFNSNGKMICPYKKKSFSSNLFSDDEKIKNDKIYQAKYLCMLHNNVKIITEKELKPIFKYLNEKYGKNYLKSFKVKSKK